jgi:plastocyanin
MMKMLSMACLGLAAIATVAFAADVPVVQKNQTFSTLALTVHAGDKVVFENDDTVTHNVTIRGADGDADDLGLQKPGLKLSYKFETKGVYRVVCSIHPRMKMTVTAQ